MQTAIQYRDETILCCECTKPFQFSSAEQAQFAERGYENKPKRCRACREAKKNGRKPKQSYAARHLADRDLLVEMCKAVNELQVLVAHRFDRIEEQIENLARNQDHGEKEGQEKDQEKDPS